MEQFIGDLYDKGRNAYIKSNYKTALNCFKDCLNIAKQENFVDCIANCLEFIGLCYKCMADDLFDKAEEEFFSSNDGGIDEYADASTNYKLGIKYLNKAKNYFKLDDVATIMGKEKTKLYFDRCTENIQMCYDSIEKCNEKTELLK